MSEGEMRTRLRRLGLYGLERRLDELSSEPWLARMVSLEEAERHRRGMERRARHARLGQFKQRSVFNSKAGSRGHALNIQAAHGQILAQ